MENPENLIPLALNVGYAVHESDWNWKNVRRPFARLYYVSAGEADVMLPDGMIHLTPGNLYLIPSYTLHSDVCNGHFEHYYVHLYEDLENESSMFENYSFPKEVKANDLDLALFKRLCDMDPSMKLPESNPSSYDNATSLLENIRRNKVRSFSDRVEGRGIILVLLSRFFKEATPKTLVNDDRIQRVLLYIRRNLHERLDIDNLANMAFISRDHFIRIFKEETGSTPVQYITQRKIERAELMLSTEEMPVKSIAYSLGFDDHSYFNRLFKKIVGKTPLEYRNSTYVFRP